MNSNEEQLTKSKRRRLGILSLTLLIAVAVTMNGAQYPAADFVIIILPIAAFVSVAIAIESRFRTGRLGIAALVGIIIPMLLIYPIAIVHSLFLMVGFILPCALDITAAIILLGFMRIRRKV